MSDTPRCDDAMWEAQDLARSALVVYLSFAKKLERELSVAQAEVDRLKDLLLGPPQVAMPQDLLKERMLRQAEGMRNVPLASAGEET